MITGSEFQEKDSKGQRDRGRPNNITLRGRIASLETGTLGLLK